MTKRVNKGSIGISSGTGQMLAAESLGSTLAVIAADPEASVAGMAVLVLPGQKGAGPVASGASLLKELFVQVLKAGARRDGLKVVLAGAAGFLREPEVLCLGRELYRFVKKSLLKSGISISAEHVGGPVNRDVVVDVASGQVKITMADEREVIL